MDLLNETQKQVVSNLFHVSQVQYQVWLTDYLFTWRWWLGIVLAIAPWILWILFRKKQSTNRMLYAGFFSMVVSIILDELGTDLTLWAYPFKIFPSLPAYAPWDTTLIPVVIMVFIEYKPEVHFLIKALVFSAISAFVMEPLFIWLRMYIPLKWHVIYSFSIYILLYSICHFLSRRRNFDPV